jgi:adenosine deaminase
VTPRVERNPDRADDVWIRALPKAEVHCHLEGCVPPELARRAAVGRGGDPDGWPTLPVADLAALLDYLDFSCGVIDRPDDLATIAYDTMARARASGTGHMDVICNPTHWPAWRGRIASMVDALDAGFKEAEHDGLGTASVCLSLKRNQTSAEAMDLVDWIAGAGRHRVVGLSIDGNEADGASSHTDRFEPAFRRAAELGLRRCAHAGESSGPQGVRDAVDRLGAERVDHGVRCVEDPSLVAELATRRVPLDVCPSSNVTLRIVPSLTDHPVEQLRAAGVRVSLNTDDPLLFGVDLPGEYLRCAQQFDWDRACVASLARTALEVCFADPDRQRELLSDHDRFVTEEAARPADIGAGGTALSGDPT